MNDGVFLIAGLFAWLITLVIGVFVLVCYAKIFKKGGEPAWAAIVPFYNIWVLYKLAFGKDKGYYALSIFIPCLNIVLAIVALVKLLKNFGADVVLVVCVIFVAPIGLGLWAFSDKYQYLGVVDNNDATSYQSQQYQQYQQPYTNYQYQQPNAQYNQQYQQSNMQYQQGNMQYQQSNMQYNQQYQQPDAQYNQQYGQQDVWNTNNGSQN